MLTVLWFWGKKRGKGEREPQVTARRGGKGNERGRKREQEEGEEKSDYPLSQM